MLSQRPGLLGFENKERDQLLVDLFLAKCDYNLPDRSNVWVKGWDHKCFKGDKVSLCTSFLLTKTCMDKKRTYLFGLSEIDI